jgi:dTDP-4-amino-4,6-dideoxygalactose transaminase
MSTTAAATSTSNKPASAAPAVAETQVPLLDLKAQYATIRAEVEPVVREVIESQYFIGGPKVEQLEKEIAVYCRCDHAIGCANGSDAILVALQALDVGPGDEVLCPTYTFFATAGAIHRLGAKPVFAEIDPTTYNICPDSIRAAFKKHPKIKALVPVHLFGQAAHLDAILEIGKEKGVPVVEDAAQAIGTEDNHGIRVGSRGAIGTFSFFPSKNLGGFGDGGIITSNDKHLADRMRRLRNHGMEPRYYHDEVGLNSRLDALQAAVLSVKLRHLDAWSDGRQKNAAFYDERFAAAGAATSATPLAGASGLALRTPHPAPKGARHIYNQYVVRVPAAIRDAVRDDLTKRKIGTEVYYPVPLHMQKCFEFLGYGVGAFPQSELAAKETIALPIYADLTPAQLQWVATSVIESVRSRG